MSTKIDQKITAYKVINLEADVITEDLPIAKPDILHEAVQRPEMLMGSTYKIKTPQSEHALYITINDIVLNKDTDDEERRPYEVFINSKNMEHFQWVLALTRVISACFRKGGDICFLVEELKAVFDPKGGYFKPGGVYMPSLVAEIGSAIESHMIDIKILKVDEMDDQHKRFLAEKRQEFEACYPSNKAVVDEIESDFPSQAQLCSKCLTKALVMMDGCMTCLNCGDSKCA
jgi:hypothetical protein